MYLRRVIIMITLCLSVAQTGDSVAQRIEPCFGSALLLGDSNVYGALGHALQREFQERGTLVFREARPGSGLARPDFFDWPIESRLLVEIIEPDVVVIMLGGNDIQRMRDLKGRFADGIPWEEVSPWADEYLRRLDDLHASLTASVTLDPRPARRVIFLSPTNRRPQKNRERVQRVVELQRLALGERNKLLFVDAYALTSDAHGRFLNKGADRQGKHARYRKGDGIHFTRAGADHLAARLRPIVFRGCPGSLPLGSRAGAQWRPSSR